MSTKISYRKVKTKEEAFLRVKERISSEAISRFNIKADLAYDNESSEISALGKGFNLKIKFCSCEALVNLDVSIFLRPMRNKILEVLENNLKEIL